MYTCRNLYQPAVIGDEYIFFLFDRGEGNTVRENVYEIVNITDGKFPVLKETINTQSSDELSNSELNIEEGLKALTDKRKTPSYITGEVII